MDKVTLLFYFFDFCNHINVLNTNKQKTEQHGWGEGKTKTKWKHKLVNPTVFHKNNNHNKGGRD